MLARPTDYTDLDYASLRSRLLALATSAFPDVAWDSEAELETLLLELNAYVGDVLGKYINSAARESRITTVTQRRNIIALCKLIGFRPRGARSASVTETFTISAVAPADVNFPAGTIVKTAEITNPIKFQLLSDLTIVAGQLSAAGTVENSEAQSDSFASSGLADQDFILSHTPYLDDSATVQADDGPYTQVDNFLSSSATDRHFTVAVDQLDRAKLIFGNARNGSVPSGTVVITYKTGGGVAGNVIATKINRIEGTFTDRHGNSVRVSVSNALKAEGGVERQTLAQIRELAPESIRVISRAIAREDFEIGARLVAGVARALMLTKNEDPGVPENSGILFLVPDGGGAASAGLIADVLAQFEPDGPYPTMNTFLLTAQTAAYLTVNISAKVYVRRGYAPAAVGAEIRLRVTDFFSLRIRASRLAELAPALGYSSSDTAEVLNPLVDFGYAIQDIDGVPTGSFAYSDVYNLVRDTPGVMKVAADVDGLLVNGARLDVDIDAFQFPIAGTVGLIDAGTGLAM